jgi:4-hydroxybenzoate polyprenyltransferase
MDEPQDPLIHALAQINQNTLWASCLWSAIALGYCVYGKKQKSLTPWLGGFVMGAACFMSSVLWMSLICIAAMFAVWWLLRQGY